MEFVVYILVNAGRSRTYVGQTDNVDRRLGEHNTGRVRSTRGKGPWELLHREACESRAEAMEREKYYKSSRGRKVIKELMMERCPSG